MNIEFTPSAWEDYNFWLKLDSSKAEKIRELIRAIRQDPFKGLGSPEPLKHELQGFWSRRIDSEHRLVYRISGKKGNDYKLQIIQCRYDYGQT